MENNIYTKPSLRAGILARLKAKAGGKHSARLMQLVSLAYKKAGGGYKSDPNKTQKSLKKWTGEKWGYSSKAVASKVKSTGKIARYLPEKAWAKLSSSEKSATNKRKLLSKKQFVSNTAAAKKAGASTRNG